MKSETGLLISIFALALIAINHFVFMPWMIADIERKVKEGPTIQFYTQDAYRNCEAMGAYARANGYKAWVCNPPMPERAK